MSGVSQSSGQGDGGQADRDGDHLRQYELNQVARSLSNLHEQVARRRVRVEITRDGCDDCCVLISKQELDALERALAILADTDGVKAVSDKIAQLAAAARAEFAGASA